MSFLNCVAIGLVFLVSASHSGNVERELEPEVPVPYSFSYTAGRHPGNVDRVHAETSDGSGVVRGMFSYIDPRYKVRTVEYIADQNGFHPILITNPVSDTGAVARAKEKHQALYNKIASKHQAIAIERGQFGTEDDGQYNQEIYPANPYVVVDHPRDTPVVENAKTKHINLYQKIAEEHARIAAEREANIPQKEEIIYQF